MPKKDDLTRLMDQQISLEQKYLFDNKAYLKVLNEISEISPLSEFVCSKTTCISDSEKINQHLARLICKDRNQEITLEKDFATEFVKYYENQANNKRKNLKYVKYVLASSGDAVTILWTFIPYIFDNLRNKQEYTASESMELIFKWIELTYFFNKVIIQSDDPELVVVPFSRIKMGYYLSTDSHHISHKFTKDEANYLSEKLIEQLG